MTRRLFPEDRTVIVPTGGLMHTGRAGAQVLLFVDGDPTGPPAAVTPADYRRSDGSTGPILVDSDSQTAEWLGSDDGATTMIARVDGGPPWRVYARQQDRIDDLDDRLQAIETGGAGGPDIAAIAALTPADGDVLQRTAGAWSNRTPAQLKMSLVLAKGDVGLGAVDNTADSAKPISALTQTALDGKASAARTITAGTGLTGGGDLTANRTLTVTYGSSAGTAAQGNDSRIVGAEQAANKGQVSGYAGLDSGGLVPVAQLPVGTSTGTVAAGNDSRIADATTAIGTVDGRVNQCLAVVFYTGSAWPTRPAGFVSVEWRGPDANRPPVGGGYALDGFDTFFPIA